MRHFNARSLMLAAGVLVTLQAAVAQEPPMPSPSSDTLYNTAYGTASLNNLNDATYAAGENSAFGAGALNGNLGGVGNTGVGYQAIYSNQSGSYNTSVGWASLWENNSGSANTGTGYQALGNQTGSNNSAFGYSALQGSVAAGVISTGGFNTAVGSVALYGNSTGSYNSATGSQALYTNTAGNYNTANGANALLANTSGSYATALGAYALRANTTGESNTGFGAYALPANTTGGNNIGIGVQSLYQNATGSNNIAVGFQAAYNLINGSNTIEIGSAGAAGDKNLIRLGTQGTQTEAIIAGVYGSTVTGSAVYVTSAGKLGVLASSERYKTAIAPMGSNSEKLQQLRPVTFQLKNDPSGAVQYGLIAEEVNKVYPELVIRDDLGTIQGLRYEELTPMLLNEVQKQQARIEALSNQNAEQARQIADIKHQQQDQIAAQSAQIKALQQQFVALTEKLQAREALVAQR
jgi:polyhydroxyalkanoate synthesis regulator phasin